MFGELVAKSVHSCVSQVDRALCVPGGVTQLGPVTYKWPAEIPSPPENRSLFLYTDAQGALSWQAEKDDPSGGAFDNVTVEATLTVAGSGTAVFEGDSTFQGTATFGGTTSLKSLELKGSLVSNPDGPGEGNPSPAVLMNMRTLSGGSPPTKRISTSNTRPSTKTRDRPPRRRLKSKAGRLHSRTCL